MSFAGVIGQQRVTNLLGRIEASGQIPHALLFVGPEGSGKDAVALHLARRLLCSDRRPGDDPCDACSACRAVIAMQHPNLTFVCALPSGKNEDGRSDHPLARLSESELEAVREELRLKGEDPYHRIEIAKAQQIKISSIRQVRRDLSKGISSPGPRVVIVSEAERMRKEAANAFLKTLEEPAADTRIILTTSNPDRLPATILSRCQIVRFDRLDESAISEALTSRYEASREQAALASRLAQGSLTRAIELLSEEVAHERLDVLTFLRSALKRSPLAAHEAIESITAGSDRHRIERLLNLLVLWLRDVFVLSVTDGDRHVVNTDQRHDMESFLKNFPHAPVSEMIESTEEGIASIRTHAQPSLVLTVLAMRLTDACYSTDRK